MFIPCLFGDIKIKKKKQNMQNRIRFQRKIIWKKSCRVFVVHCNNLRHDVLAYILITKAIFFITEQANSHTITVILLTLKTNTYVLPTVKNLKLQILENCKR